MYRSICAAVCILRPKFTRGSAVAWWLIHRTPDPAVGGSSPTRVKPCCVLEQGTFTPQKVLVIPRKRWLRPNITGKLFTGTIRINQPTNQPSSHNHLIYDNTMRCFLLKLSSPVPFKAFSRRVILRRHFGVLYLRS